VCVCVCVNCPAWASVFGAGLFLLIQLVLLIDFAHSWAESWVAKYEEDPENNKVWYGVCIVNNFYNHCGEELSSNNHGLVWILVTHQVLWTSWLHWFHVYLCACHVDRHVRVLEQQRSMVQSFDHWSQLGVGSVDYGCIGSSTSA
jgi:hypothetical protein